MAPPFPIANLGSQLPVIMEANNATPATNENTRHGQENLVDQSDDPSRNDEPQGQPPKEPITENTEVAAPPSEGTEVPPNAEAQGTEQVEDIPPEPQTCTICDESVEHHRDQSRFPEVAVHLPCGHFFGHVCLLRVIRGVDNSNLVCPTGGCIKLRHTCGHTTIPSTEPPSTVFQVLDQPINSMCEFCMSPKGVKFHEKRDAAIHSAREEGARRQSHGLGLRKKVKHNVNWFIDTRTERWYSYRIESGYDKMMDSRTKALDKQAKRAARRNADARRAEEKRVETQRRREARDALHQARAEEDQLVRDANGALQQAKATKKQQKQNANQSWDQAKAQVKQLKKDAHQATERVIEEEKQRRRDAEAAQRAADHIRRTSEAEPFISLPVGYFS